MTSEESATSSGVAPFLRLQAGHATLLSMSEAPCYGLDMRNHLGLSVLDLEGDPEMSDYCEIGLTDVREAALEAIDGVLRAAGPDSILSDAYPVSDAWWISLSPDGRIASHVGSRLAQLPAEHDVDAHDLSLDAQNEIAELSSILSWCEKALAAARAVLAAADLKRTLTELMQFENLCDPQMPAKHGLT